MRNKKVPRGYTSKFISRQTITRPARDLPNLAAQPNLPLLFRKAAAAAAPVEAKQEAATAAAAAGVQAMAVTVVRDVEAGPDASTSGQGGDKPSWFTPKR